MRSSIRAPSVRYGTKLGSSSVWWLRDSWRISSSVMAAVSRRFEAGQQGHTSGADRQIGKKMSESMEEDD